MDLPNYSAVPESFVGKPVVPRLGWKLAGPELHA